MAADILDTTGMDLTGADPMAAYEELLSTLENVVYSELIDFEQDGSPELLVITMDFYEYPSDFNIGWDNIIVIYQDESNKPRTSFLSSSNICAEGTYSLVESNGKLFVRRWVLEKEGGRTFEYYCGCVAQNDGVKEDWGTVDRLCVDGNGVWIYPHKENGLIVEGIPDHYDDGEIVQSKYTHVRDLVSYDGTTVTVLG